MITKFKIFEGIKRQPRRKDYVIVDLSFPDTRSFPDKVKDFLENNIGQIVDIAARSYLKYKIKYENVPESLLGGFIFKRDVDKGTNNAICVLDEDSFLSYSKNKEDIELILNSKKYNL
jgi:hypothetical protein